MNAQPVSGTAPTTATHEDVRPYIIRTYDRWIILVLVLVVGWLLFRPLIAFTVYYRGVNFERLFRFADAEYYYRKSTRVDPKVPQGWQAWGELALMRAPSDPAAWQSSKDIFSRGLDYNPTFAPLAFDLGRTYLIKKDYPNALAAFEQSARNAPNDIMSLDFAAWSSLKSGNVALARSYWRQLLKVDPGNVTAARQLRKLGG